MKILLVLFALVLFSCSNSEVGCWKTESLSSHGFEMPGDEEDTFCFEDDGTVYFERNGVVNREGTYSRSDDGRMIILTYNNDFEETWNNVSVSGSEMTFEGQDFTVVMKRQ